MSRIGKKAITLPTGVTITPGATEIVVKGSKGELKVVNFPGITVEVVEGKVQVGRTNEERQTRAYHGLVRSLIENAVEGVNTGYKITLKLVGTILWKPLLNSEKSCCLPHWYSTQCT
jgi:large subunit ribosomal protein L6